MTAEAPIFGTRPGIAIPGSLLALLLILIAPGLATAQDGGLAGSGVLFSKSFGPAAIGPGSASRLVFTIENTSGVPVTEVAFTDTLPAVVTLADPAAPGHGCAAGTVSAPDGGSTITFSGGEIAAGAVCTVEALVTSSTVGTHTNVSGDLTSSAGNSGSAMADLTVATDRPGFTKAFSPSSASLGSRSTLTFTIDNSANASNVVNVDFTDNLPTGMVVADPSAASTDCVSNLNDTTLTADPGTGTIILDANGSSFGGNEVLTAGSACSVSVDVVANAGGSLDNVSGDLLADFTAIGRAVDTLESAAGDIILVKEFLDDPAPPGGAVDLEFTILNRDRVNDATGISFTDDLDATLSGLVAVGLPAAVCGGTLSGTSILNFVGGTVAASSECSFTVSLQVPAGAVPGTYTNTTSGIEADFGGAEPIFGGPASDDLFVFPVPALEKTFLDNPVGPGSSTRMEFTITNTSATSTASGIAFTDDLAAFLGIVPTVSGLPASGFCGGTSSVFYSTFSGVLSIADASLAAGDSCTFEATLDIPVGFAGGTYTNVTSEIAATVDGNELSGSPASAELDVARAPRLSKSFTDDPADPGGTVTLEFTVDYEAGESVTADATDITFSDDLDAALTGLVAVGLPMNDVCGTGSAISGTTNLSFTGGTLSPGETCTFAVTLQVPPDAPPGFHTNTTSDLTASVAGQAVTELAATDRLLISGIELAKEFIDDPVIAGDTVTLRFELTNGNPDFAATNISFSDDLGAALPGLSATGLPASDVCGAGSQVSGTTAISLTGGTVAAGGSCIFDVIVQVPAAAATGDYLNVTSAVTATMGGSVIQFPSATDLLSVDNDLIDLDKVFTDDPAVPGGTVTLEFTLTNLSATETITDIGFTDDLDSALAGLASESGSLPDVCGSGSSLSGTGLLTFSGGSLGPSESCTFSAILRLPASIGTDGNALNTTSAVAGDVGGLAVQGPEASDVLVINQAGFSKGFASTAAPTRTVELQFVIENLSGSQALSGLAFIDDLDAVLPGLVAVNTPVADPCGSGSSLTGSSVLTFSGGSLDAGGSCTFSVLLEVPAGAAPGSYANVTSDLTTGGLFLSDPASANLGIQPPPAFGKVFSPNAIAIDAVSTLSFQIDNTGSSLAADSMAFVDNLPAGVQVATTPNVSSDCGGSVSAAAGSSTIELSGGSVAAGAVCSISVDVTGTVEGSFDNVTDPLVSSNGDSGTAADTLDVVSDEFGFSKAFRTQPVVPGGLVEMEISVVNGSTFPLSDIALSDDLGAVLPGLAAEGLPLVDPCGAGSQMSGTSLVTLTGGSLPAGGSCTIVVPVRVPGDAMTGSYTNTTSSATAVREGVDVEVVPVSADLVIEPVGFSKAFDVVATGAASSVTLSLTITNPDQANALANLEFTDDLNAFLSGATAGNTPISEACGTGSSLTGTSVLALAGGRLSPGGSCTMEVTVDIPADAAPGDYNNTTSDLGGEVSGTAFSAGPAEAALTIEAAPEFSKAFSPQTMAVESVSTLTFVIDNSASQLSADSLAFTDNLPAGLEVAAMPAISNTCGGTVAASAAATTIQLSGGSVAAGSSCQIQVDVTTDQFGVFNNVTEDLTSSLGNSGQATATLTIDDDLDGVPGSIEDQAPNGGDGNDDGTLDSIQSDVASLPTFDGATFMTLIITDGCDQLNDVVAVDPATQPPAPPALLFPFGLVAFELPCESAVVDVVFHGSGGNIGSAYWKHGPTVPGDISTADWYEFSDQPAGAPIGATASANVWTLMLADNELGDDTADDGLIVDQGGPVDLAIPVPVLNRSGIVVLLLSLLMFVGLRRIWARKAVDAL